MKISGIFSNILYLIDKMFGNSELKKRILLGGIWVIVGQIVLFFVSLAVNALLARLVAPDELGAYFLTLSLVSFASLVSIFGLDRAVIRLVAEPLAMGQPGRARKAINSVVKIVGFSIFIVSAFILLRGGAWVAKLLFHSELMLSVVWLIPLWIAVSVFPALIGEIFRGFNEISRATLLGGVSTKIFLLVFLLGLWFFIGHGNLTLIVSVTVLAGGLSLILAFLLLYFKMRLLPRGSSENVSPKQILVYSWPFWITNLLLFFLLQADLWILGMFAPQSAVALYGASTRLVAIVTTPLMLVNALAPPIIVEMHTRGEIRKLEKALQKMITWVGIPAILVFAFMFFCARQILGLIYGDYYRDGGSLLAILSIGQFFNVWAGSCGQVLMLTGHQKIMMYASIIGGCVAILGSLLLVRDWGGWGVAIASSSGMIVQNLLMLIAAKKTVNIWTHMDFRLLFEHSV